jgi:hypothetical protein
MTGPRENRAARLRLGEWFADGAGARVVGGGIARFDAVEQRDDHRSQCLAARQDGADIVGVRGAQAIVHEEKFSEPVDRVERIPKFMRHLMKIRAEALRVGFTSSEIVPRYAHNKNPV